MAIKHFEHPCTVHFMGSHPGTFNIDRDDEAMTIKGEAIVKIIKTPSATARWTPTSISTRTATSPAVPKAS